MQASLSKIAESALLNGIRSKKHGDTLYFWVRMDEDPRNPLKQNFWSFCDSINAGNCKSVSKILLSFLGFGTADVSSFYFVNSSNLCLVVELLSRMLSRECTD